MNTPQHAIDAARADEANQLEKLVKTLQHREEARRMHDASQLESDSIVASCECLTKTNELKYHKPGCKYRLIMERNELRAEVERLSTLVSVRFDDGKRLGFLETEEKFRARVAELEKDRERVNHLLKLNVEMNKRDGGNYFLPETREGVDCQFRVDAARAKEDAT